MWKIMPQQQQRGAQLQHRGRGDAPAGAVKDRAAREHEWDEAVQPPHGVRAGKDLPLPEGK